MGWAACLPAGRPGGVNSNWLMVFPYNQRPSSKPAAQSINLKPDLVLYKMEYQKFLDNLNSK